MYIKRARFVSDRSDKNIYLRKTNRNRVNAYKDKRNDFNAFELNLDSVVCIGSGHK